MANTSKTPDKTTGETVNGQVTVDKAQLDEILNGYNEMKAELESMKIGSAMTVASVEQKKAEREQKLIAQIEEANAKAEEEIEYYVDSGSLKSNKNLEVNINGTQYNIPKGQKVMLPRKVVEVIENSKNQHARARGVQETRAAEAQKAIEAGRI